MDKQTSDERLLKIIEGTNESRRPGVNIPGAKKPLGQVAAHPLVMKFNLATLKNIFKNLKLDKFSFILLGY